MALLVAACSAKPYESGAVQHLFAYDAKSLSGFLGAGDRGILRVDRDSRGERLFVFPLGEPGDPVVILRSGQKPTTKPLPGRIAFLGDDEEFVAWSQGDSGEFCFANGTRVQRKKNLGTEYGGHYYFNASDAETEIATTAAPAQILVRSKLKGHTLFLKDGLLYLCGTTDEVRRWAFDIFEGGDQGWHLRERVDLGAFSVRDLDPFSNLMLLTLVRDDPFKSEWLVFDLKTKERKSIGSVRDFGLFLAKDPLAGLPPR